MASRGLWSLSNSTWVPYMKWWTLVTANTVVKRPFIIWAQCLSHSVNDLDVYATGWEFCIKHAPALLTHWGRVTHICVSKLCIISSDNGLPPGRRQAIIWTNAGILLIGSMEKNFYKILSKIHTFSLKKMHLKMSSGQCRTSCLGLNMVMMLQPVW